MAAIDKIYLTRGEAKEFHAWCKGMDEKCKEDTGYRISSLIRDESFWDEYIEGGYNPEKKLPVCNLPEFMEYWLIQNCEIPFIVSDFKTRYRSTYESIKEGTAECLKEREYEKATRYKIRWLSKKNQRIKKGKVLFCNVEEEGYYWWYLEEIDKWECCGYKPTSYLGGRCSHCVGKYKSIKAILRAIRKWELPKGCKVNVRGRYEGQSCDIYCQ